MNKKFKIGVIGYGRMGKIHLKNIAAHPLVDRVAIADPKSIEVPDNICTYTEYKDLIGSESPDALIICTPTPTHYDIIMTCCASNIHVFCEKPVDQDLDKLEELEKKVSESKINLQVGFNRRYDPDFAHLQKRLANGELGEIHQITLFSRDPGLPSMQYIESSGGMMMDMTIHDFDMCRFLSGSEVKSIYTIGQVKIDKEVAKYGDKDTATSILTMENDVICTIHNSREAAYGYDQRIEVFGKGGMLQVSNNLEDRISKWSNPGMTAARPMNFFLERYEQSYKEEIDAFLRLLRDGGSPTIGLGDAINATKIAAAANRSIEEGGVVMM